MHARTVFTVLEETVAQQGNAPALHQPKGGGKYTVYTWNDYRTAVVELGVGLAGLGVKHGDIVAIQSETRAEFYLADLAIMSIGAISAGLYSSYPALDQVKNLKACGARVLVIENAKQMAAIANAMKTQPLPIEFVLMEGQVEGAHTLDELRANGRRTLQERPEAFTELAARVSPSDPAILYLTSGATGEPKMGLATHGSISLNVDMGPAVLPLGPADRALVFLPSAHIAQRVVMQLLMMRMAVPCWFSESLARMPQELKTLRPTFLLAPPRVWERIYASIKTEVNKKGALTQRLFHGAVGLGLKASEYRQRGESIPGWLSAPLGWADKLVFAKLRERLGNSIRVAISGAAPLGRDTAMFFDAIGMPITEGYGLTEGGVLTMNPVDRQVYGTIGKPLPGVEVKLADDGELLIKSPSLFSGYFHDPAATASIMRDGWLATGDIASINAEGYISITGRKKEILVSSSGKKIYPARIEALFKSEALISQMVLVGDRLPFVTALFTINPAVAETLPGMQQGQAFGAAKPIDEVLRRAVKQANTTLPEWEQIRKFRVLNRDFSVDTGELTPTMKVRRGKVLENFKDDVSALYGGKEESH
ncbi:MAG: long-chain fatty acid--CoA ligase [Bryobacteraceae bacterium]|nr:long-chain fatty acid--CoA ligase [Bryobacteraceae bacterium]